MKGYKTSTRTPETPKLAEEALASFKAITRSENLLGSPGVHPYLAIILSGNKPVTESLHKLIEEHRKEKPGDL